MNCWFHYHYSNFPSNILQKRAKITLQTPPWKKFPVQLTFVASSESTFLRFHRDFIELSACFHLIKQFIEFTRILAFVLWYRFSVDSPFDVTRNAKLVFERKSFVNPFWLMWKSFCLWILHWYNSFSRPNYEYKEFSFFFRLLLVPFAARSDYTAFWSFEKSLWNRAQNVHFHDESSFNFGKATQQYLKNELTGSYFCLFNRYTCYPHTFKGFHKASWRNTREREGKLVLSCLCKQEHNLKNHKSHNQHGNAWLAL